MKREKIDIEIELRSKSANIIWPMLSTAPGLAKWIADDVKEDGGVLTFTWGNPQGHSDMRRAEIVENRKFDHVRYRWLAEGFEDSYWELRMEKGDITDDYILCITDFAPEGDSELIKDIWDSNFERLHQNTGL